MTILSTILRKVKRLTATIKWHYWIDWAQKSRKNGLTCKRQKCCSTKTMHRATSPWKRWSMENDKNDALCQPEKNALGKKIWLQWRSDCRNWSLFWEQRLIILQKRHRKVREALKWMYYAWSKLCWWIKSNHSKKLCFS